MPGEICAIKNFAGRFRVKAINFDTFWVLLQHFISVTPALLFAYLFRLGVVWVWGPKDQTRLILLLMDDVTFVGLVGWLNYQVGVELWNRRQRINFHVFAMA
jgi:hypothetical protein